MHNRMKADLYAAGITSPDGLRCAIDHATLRAEPAPRLTPSRRYRRWKVITARLAVAGMACMAIYLWSVQ